MPGLLADAEGVLHVLRTLRRLSPQDAVATLQLAGLEQALFHEPIALFQALPAHLELGPARIEHPLFTCRLHAEIVLHTAVVFLHERAAAVLTRATHLADQALLLDVACGPREIRLPFTLLAPACNTKTKESSHLQGQDGSHAILLACSSRECKQDSPAPALESRVIKSELHKSELHKSELRVSLGFSAAGALCSAAYLFPYKRAAAFAAPSVLAFALLVVAALLNTAFSMWRLRQSGAVASEPRLLWATSSLLALLTISGNLCGAQAISRLDPAIASVLLRTEVVFVGGLGALLLNERVSWTLALGAGLALTGLCVMRWPLAFDAGGVGAAWALGGACSFGLMQVLTRRVIRRISPLTVNAMRLWLAVAVLAFVPGLLSSAVGAGKRFWAFVALAGLLGPFLGRLCIMYSLRALEAAHSALLLLLAPILAFIIGYVVWGTLPSSHESAGGALMLLGISLPSLVALGNRARPSRARTS